MELNKYLEYNIYKSKVFSKILQSQQVQIDNLSSNLIDIENQAYIHTATWALKYWEEELGINCDNNDTIENRRSKCLAKIRGYGNVTIEKIKNICLSYVYDTNVIEYFDKYKFKIELINKKGYKENITDLIEIINLIKPAHLELEMKFISLTNDDLLFRTVSTYGEEVQIFPYSISNIETKGRINIALGNTQNAEIINVKPI